MNIVLIDPSLAGVSGDKILSAFAAASGRHVELEGAINRCMEAIGKREVSVNFEAATVYGIKGIRMKIKGAEARNADPFKTLEEAAERIRLSDRSRKLAIEAMRILIDAERKVHGGEELHEVASIDTTVDIIGTAKAIELSDLEGAIFYTTPVALGSGSALSEHGEIPVPAPATLSILRDAKIPVTKTWVTNELTTPTGAAILAALTQGRAEPPPFIISARPPGIGIGNYELGFPNILRVILGEEDGVRESDEIFIVETNVDDVDGETLGWLIEKLGGMAEDICIVPMTTKKNRPGHIIRAVATYENKEKIARTLMEESGTLGVKIMRCSRVKAERREEERKVRISGKEYAIRIKKNLDSGGEKPAYDDCRRIAIELGMPLRKVVEMVRRQTAD